MDWWYWRQGLRLVGINEWGRLKYKKTNIKTNIVDFSVELSLPYPGLPWTCRVFQFFRDNALLHIVKGKVYWMDEEMDRELFCQYKQNLHSLLKHLQQTLFYMADLGVLEFEAAKLSVGGRHPTFIYFSLG